MTFLRDRLHVQIPILQAPMAGVSTPAMAAAVSNAGALGAIAVGAVDAAAAREMITQVKAATSRAFNVNLFCHARPHADEARARAWLDSLRPAFAAFGAEPPRELREIYKSFVTDDAMLAVLLETRPAVVSFHFGLPPADRIAALQKAGITLLATATSLAEARAIEAAGIDAIVAQGIEAGGHRGAFDPEAFDEGLGTMALTRLLVRGQSRPVIAAGGIMDGAGVAAALGLGAQAAQLGTAFVASPESSADAAYRALLAGPEPRTTMTRAISGRPARSLLNRFTALGEALGEVAVPDYPLAYDAGKALHAAAKAKGKHGYGAHWAGQGAAMSRSLPAAALVEKLHEEMLTAMSGR